MFVVCCLLCMQSMYSVFLLFPEETSTEAHTRKTCFVLLITILDLVQPGLKLHTLFALTSKAGLLLILIINYIVGLRDGRVIDSVAEYCNQTRLKSVIKRDYCSIAAECCNDERLLLVSACWYSVVCLLACLLACILNLLVLLAVASCFFCVLSPLKFKLEKGWKIQLHVKGSYKKYNNH